MVRSSLAGTTSTRTQSVPFVARESSSPFVTVQESRPFLVCARGRWLSRTRSREGGSDNLVLYRAARSVRATDLKKSRDACHKSISHQEIRSYAASALTSMGVRLVHRIRHRREAYD
jgi:hypothetical protein